MKTWDVIIIGGGIIGLSLSLALRKKGARVLIVERGEPGREASHAAGGMLADCTLETPASLQPLATASAHLYPEFVHEIELDSGRKVDLRDYGTILFLSHHSPMNAESASWNALHAPLIELESALALTDQSAFFLKERSVDPRALTHATWQAAKHREVDFSSGDPVTAVNLTEGRASGVTTARTTFHAPVIVNCAGAWSGQISLHSLPTRPVKGQMLCLIAPSRTLLKYVIRTPDVYLIPRSDGRIVIGSTLEEAGFDKRVDLATIQRLHHAALELVPELRNARILEDWAGLRPGTPDSLPILGATPTPGYFVATGHFRDGILLAPITAKIMADVITGAKSEYDLSPFSLSRFF